MDAVRQYGYPSFFLTISPLEWTFPWPHLLEHIRDMTGKGPTELPCLKTACIAHVLEQLVRGHLCGTNINAGTPTPSGTAPTRPDVTWKPSSICTCLSGSRTCGKSALTSSELPYHGLSQMTPISSRTSSLRTVWSYQCQHDRCTSKKRELAPAWHLNTAQRPHTKHQSVCDDPFGHSMLPHQHPVF